MSISLYYIQSAYDPDPYILFISLSIALVLMKRILGQKLSDFTKYTLFVSKNQHSVDAKWIAG
jgi:hypothetical protein